MITGQCVKVRGPRDRSGTSPGPVPTGGRCGESSAQWSARGRLTWKGHDVPGEGNRTLTPGTSHFSNLSRDRRSPEASGVSLQSSV